MTIATIIDRILSFRPPFAVKPIEESLGVAFVQDPDLTTPYTDVWIGRPVRPSPIHAVELRFAKGDSAAVMVAIHFSEDGLLSEDELVSELGSPESFDVEADAIAVRLTYSRDWGTLEVSFDTDGRRLQNIVLSANPPQANA